jgi:hypothetical protein
VIASGKSAGREGKATPGLPRIMGMAVWREGKLEKRLAQQGEPLLEALWAVVQEVTE